MPTAKLVTAVPQGDNGSQRQGTPVVGRPLDTSEFLVQIGGSIDSVRQEIDDAFADMRTFLNREPDEIMRMAAGHSARLSELRVKAMRIEDLRREWRNVRTRELEPTIEELRNQYQIASRLFSVRQLDWEMEAGRGS